MRVLVLHNRYRYPGGEDAVVRREAAMLRNHGVEVRQHAVDNEVEHGVLGNVALLARAAWSRDSYEGVLETCREFRPDIVHVHNFWMRLTPSVHAAARLAGAATVQTLHNYRLVCVNGFLLRQGQVCEDCLGSAPWLGVVRSCYHDSAIASGFAARFIVHHRRRATWSRDVDAFIVPSEAARQRLLHASLPEQRVFVKPNFLDDPGTMAALPSASRAVVFAGRLSPEKGVRTLISAWTRLLPSLRSSACLVIAGDGPQRAELEGQSAALGSSVRFAGQIPSAELMKLIQGARAVVLPSICLETFGAFVVEGFAGGRPAIVSDLGSPSELVRDGFNGYKVLVSDPGALAQALERILVNGHEADDMGHNARTDFLSNYTPGVNFRQLSRIYDFALQHRHGTPVEHPAEAACLV